MIFFCSGFEIGGHLDSMLNHIPSIYFVSVAGSFLLVVWAYLKSTEKSKPNEQNADANPDSSSNGATTVEKEEEATTVEKEEDGVNLQTSFEISATDECEFIPLVSEEEDRRIAAEIAPKTRFMELDSSNPGAHLNMYLDCLHQGDEQEDSDDQSDLDMVKDFRREDLGQYVSEKDLNVLDDPRESPSRRGTVISRVKKARQRALR